MLRPFDCPRRVRVGVRAVEACSLVGHVLLYADLFVTRKTDGWLVTVRSRDDPQVLPVVVTVARADPVSL